jgi:hypothetical protein
MQMAKASIKKQAAQFSDEKRTDKKIQYHEKNARKRYNRADVAVKDERTALNNRTALKNARAADRSRNTKAAVNGPGVAAIDKILHTTSAMTGWNAGRIFS